MKFYYFKTDTVDMNQEWAVYTSVTDSWSEYSFCPLCDKTMILPHRGRKTGWFDGWRFPDHMRYNGGNGLLVSEWFKQCYEQANLRGVELFDHIQVVGRNFPPIAYYDVVIPFSSIRLNWDTVITEEEEIVKFSDCPICGTRIWHAHGVQFDDSSWNGADIFRVQAIPNQYFVSERFVETVGAAHLTNMQFVESSVCRF